MEDTEYKTDKFQLSIGQSFLILGVLFAITIAISLLQLKLLPLATKATSWVLLLCYILQFGLTIFVVFKIFNLKNFSANYVKLNIFILSLFLIAALGLISESISSLIPMPDIVAEIFKDAIQMNFAGFLTVAIAAPILEELLFRGIILRGLLQHYTPSKAIVWSAIIFGIAHLNPWQFIAAFIVGCAIGWLYWKTNSIWIGIFMHFVNNSTSFLIAYFTGDVNTSIIDYFGETINQVIVLFCCVLITFLAIYAMKKWCFNKEC